MHYRWTDVPGKWRENYHLLNPSSVQATASTGVMWLNLTLTLWAACSILGQEAFHHGISKLPVHFEWPSIPFPRPQAFRQPKGFLDTPKTITKFLWVLFSFLMFLNPCLRYLQEVQLTSCSVSCSSPSCTSCLWFPYPTLPLSILPCNAQLCEEPLYRGPGKRWTAFEASEARQVSLSSLGLDFFIGKSDQ